MSPPDPRRCVARLVALAVALALLAACGAVAPVQDAKPAIVLSPPAPSELPGTLPANAPASVSVLRDSVLTRDAARRYVAWEGSSSANIKTLAVLSSRVAAAVQAMQATRRLGRYEIRRVLSARAAVDALQTFLQNKGD